MSCITKITADILTCEKLPTKGLKSKAWIFNADEVTFTMTKNNITAITMASGKTSFTAEGAKDFISAGYEAVVAENKLTVYKNNFSIQAFPLTAAEKENLDVVDNIIVIVEANGEKGEGVFLAYGVTNIYGNGTNSTAGANTVVHYYDRAGIKAANRKNIYGQFVSRKEMPNKMGKTFKISKFALNLTF